MSQVQKPSQLDEFIKRYVTHTPYSEAVGLERASYKDCYDKSGGDWQKFADLLDVSFGNRQSGEPGTADAERAASAPPSANVSGPSQLNPSLTAPGILQGTRLIWRGHEVIDRRIGINSSVALAAQNNVWIRFADPHAYPLSTHPCSERVELGIREFSFHAIVSMEDAAMIAIVEQHRLGVQPAGLAEILALASRQPSPIPHYIYVVAPGASGRGINRDVIMPTAERVNIGDVEVVDCTISQTTFVAAEIGFLEIISRQII
jgi:hypothetical protein